MKGLFVVSFWALTVAHHHLCCCCSSSFPTHHLNAWRKNTLNYFCMVFCFFLCTPIYFFIKKKIKIVSIWKLDNTLIMNVGCYSCKKNNSSSSIKLVQFIFLVCIKMIVFWSPIANIQTIYRGSMAYIFKCKSCLIGKKKKY